MANALDVKKLREATGMGWLAAKKFVEEHSQEDCERFVAAAKLRQEGEILRDPIEEDPAFRERIAIAQQTAEERFRVRVAERNAELIRKGMADMVREHPRGGCHFIWREMKRILKEEYGIDWRTPAEMNPTMIFD